MRAKSTERTTTEVSLDPTTQTVYSNPYQQGQHMHNPNENQERRVTQEKSPEEPPPTYNAAIQSLTLDPTRREHQKPQVENMTENSSLNSQRRPFLPGYKWPRYSTNAVCPHCGVTGYTHIETSSTAITFILAFILFLFCCCLFFIPFCIPSCKLTTHYCSNCKVLLGEVHEFQ